jgi:hypothetical protein
VYLAASLIPVVIAYTAACYSLLPERRMGGLFSWITSHAPDSGFTFNPFVSLFLTLRGSMRLIVGGKIGDFEADAVSWVAVSLATIFVFWAVLQLRAPHPGEWPRRRLRFTDPELAWLFVYVAFLFFWMPQNTFYRLFYLPPLIMIAARYVPARIIGTTAAAIALWNFAFLIHPQSEPTYNPPLAFASAIHARWAAGTPIVFHNFHPDLWTISYFNPQVSWISVNEVSAVALAKWLRYARGVEKPLWIEAEAWEAAQADPSARRWLADHENPRELIRYHYRNGEFRFYCLR